MDKLSKEQLQLLQHHLTYETYEKFMGMFDNDEDLPVEEQLRQEKIIDIMKEHDYWGEIEGWADKRVYSKIPEKWSVAHMYITTGLELMSCNTKYKVIEKLDMLERMKYPYKSWLIGEYLSV